MVLETGLYDLLEVPPTVDAAGIRRAYKKMALKLHPDRNDGDPEAAEKFKAVGEAYEVLNDEKKRATYDKYGKEAVLDPSKMGGGGDAGGWPFGGPRKPATKPKPIFHELAVSLEDMYSGKTRKLAANVDRLCQTCNGRGVKEGAPDPTCTGCKGRGVKVTMQQLAPGMMQQMQTGCDECKGKGTCPKPEDVCTTCQGEKVVKERKILEVHIEKGMKKGDRVRFTGDGDQAPGLPETGDVVIQLAEKPHDQFRRRGNHLLMNHKINLNQALCGFTLPVHHLGGRVLEIKVPKGQVIDPRFAWRVHREGMPQQGTGGTEKGDLIVMFSVEFPQSPLDDSTIELLKETLGWKKPDASVEAIAAEAVTPLAPPTPTTTPTMPLKPTSPAAPPAKEGDEKPTAAASPTVPKSPASASASSDKKGDSVKEGDEVPPASSSPKIPPPPPRPQITKCVLTAPRHKAAAPSPTSVTKDPTGHHFDAANDEEDERRAGRGGAQCRTQ